MFNCFKYFIKYKIFGYLLIFMFTLFTINTAKYFYLKSVNERSFFKDADGFHLL